MKTTPFLAAAILAGVTWASPGLAQVPGDPAVANNARSTIAATPRDGFTRGSTGVLITRNGVTERLTKDIAFKNGLRVQADGSVRLPRGETTTLGNNQILTFDGVIENVVLRPDGTAPIPSGGTTATRAMALEPVGELLEGITVSNGRAHITRDGVTQALTNDVQLPGGIRVQPDATVTLGNGTRITLREGQMMTLDGAVKAAPSPLRAK